MKLKVDLGEDAGIDMSPMIDMVFLLLIFFLVASNIVDNKIKVNIPSAVYAKVPEDTTGRLELSVAKNGDLFVGQRPVSLEELKDILRPELEQNPNLRILIRGDGEVKYRVSEEIMAACADAGANDLIFSVFEAQ
jgi:biopolymer transport protein ExbD